MASETGLTPPSASDRPRPDGSDIRKMRVADTHAVAKTLALAFLEDPHFSWIVRDPANRLTRLERGFSLFVSRVWLPHRESYTHDRCAGAALWLPPGEWHLSLIAQLMLVPAVVRALRGDTARLLRALTFVERKHPREPHWYLPVIGVAPSWQGRGYGAALLRPMLERCDAEATPAYLEASSPQNRALYERHGFEVLEECSYAHDAPPLWRMWREPHASPAG